MLTVVRKATCCVALMLAPCDVPCAHETSLLPAGTEISVLITEELTSLTHFPGEAPAFELERDVVCDGRELMRGGSEVKVRIIQAVPARAPARAGILTIELLEGTAIDGSTVRLTGIHTRRGARKLARAIVTTAVLGLLSLGRPGEEARLPKGEIVVGRTRDPTQVRGGER
jgi:hypothetical protein